MRGRIPADQLLFYPEIERTAHRENSKTRRRRQLARERRQQQEASSSSTPIENLVEGEMAGAEPNVPPRGPCVNSPRLNAQFARDQANGRNSKMKTGLLQLLYQNPFTGADHEDSFTHLTKFYEIAGTIGAPEAEEEQVFRRLFPYSLIGKAY